MLCVVYTKLTTCVDLKLIIAISEAKYSTPYLTQIVSADQFNNHVPSVTIFDCVQIQCALS